MFASVRRLFGKPTLYASSANWNVVSEELGGPPPGSEFRIEQRGFPAHDSLPHQRRQMAAATGGW
jgi:hypothetical protein